ncbi:MAG TPA: hypothetical protein VHA56_22215 [Mucilaginibacter sp.]|nr:hypothetical protein [Mucilaginibacter sp.]
MKVIKQIAYGVLLSLLVLLSAIRPAQAQSTEIQQLLLNVEKLSQLKSILSDMKQGYVVLSTGYNAVKNIAQGNFSLHEVFLDGLLLVNPEVKKYYKVAEIISDQAAILKEYKAAYERFRSRGVFSTGELDYLSRVYGQLSRESVQNLDRLLMVITASKLRMSDEERLAAIDRIYADTTDKLTFLRVFNRETELLGISRQQEQSETRNAARYFPNP